MIIKKLAGYNNIYFVDSFEKEMQRVFRGHEKKLEKLFYDLKILDLELYNALDYPNRKFEKIINHSRLFAIREKGMLNSRVLYTYIDSNEKIILLCAFCEKSKKDYSSAIAVAEERLKRLQEGEY